MSVKCLSHHDQLEIVRYTTQQRFNQTELATTYRVSRRTIQRVLINFGALRYRTKVKPMPAPAKENTLFHRGSQQKMDLPASNDPSHQSNNAIMLAMLSDKGHTPESLRTLIYTPKVAKTSVQIYLAQLPQAEFISTMGIVHRTRYNRRVRIEREQELEQANA